jgi:hypothetical protein
VKLILKVHSHQFPTSVRIQNKLGQAAGYMHAVTCDYSTVRWWDRVEAWRYTDSVIHGHTLMLIRRSSSLGEIEFLV